jgi:hypothetical protein
MKSLAVSTCTLLLLTGVAFSQDNSNTMLTKKDASDKKAFEEYKRQQETDAAYEAMLSKSKAPAAPADPWGEVRPAKAHQ